MASNNTFNGLNINNFTDSNLIELIKTLTIQNSALLQQNKELIEKLNNANVVKGDIEGLDHYIRACEITRLNEIACQEYYKYHRELREASTETSDEIFTNFYNHITKYIEIGVINKDTLAGWDNYIILMKQYLQSSIWIQGGMGRTGSYPARKVKGDELAIEAIKSIPLQLVYNQADYRITGYSEIFRLLIDLKHSPNKHIAKKLYNFKYNTFIAGGKKIDDFRQVIATFL